MVIGRLTVSFWSLMVFKMTAESWPSLRETVSGLMLYGATHFGPWAEALSA